MAVVQEIMTGEQRAMIQEQISATVISSAQHLFPNRSLEAILTELLLERAQRKLIKYQIQTRQFEAKYGGSFLDFRQTALTSPLAADVEQDYFDWELAFTGVEDMTREVAQLKQTALQQ